MIRAPSSTCCRGCNFRAQPGRRLRAALEQLIDLFSEFSFVSRLDRAVAISGLLTAQVRGSLPTAPVYLVRAHTPGTGKSYLVDVIATISTGRLCPVITTSKNAEETEKRIGSVLLSGTPIVSLDNCVHDLAGELLCQLTERPIIKIRILGRSEMPECECRTAVFATGNNIAFKGDMVRRGLVCNLEALDERPELRAFKSDAVDRAAANRGAYVAAALTIVRAYLAAGTPQVCGPFGSYSAGRPWFVVRLSGWKSRILSQAWRRPAMKTRSSPIFASSSISGLPMSSISIRPHD